VVTLRRAASKWGAQVMAGGPAIPVLGLVVLLLLSSARPMRLGEAFVVRAEKRRLAGATCSAAPLQVTIP
jgi:hypothetical protein